MATKKKVAKKTATKKLQVKKQTTQQVKMKAIITDEKGIETVVEKVDGPPVVIVEQMCNVGYSIAETINLGNYSNKKYMVSLHVPCYPDEVIKTQKAVVKRVDIWADELKDDIEKGI